MSTTESNRSESDPTARGGTTRKPQPADVRELIAERGIAPKTEYRWEHIYNQPGLSMSKKSLLRLIYDLDIGNVPNRQGRFGCYASVAGLASQLGVTRASVKAMLEELRADGYVITLHKEISGLTYRRIVLQYVVEKKPTLRTLRNGKVVNGRPEFVATKITPGSAEGQGVGSTEGPHKEIDEQSPLTPKGERTSDFSFQKRSKDWIAKVNNLPGIDALWLRFDKSALNQRIARKIHTAWFDHVINPAKLETVIDTLNCCEVDVSYAPPIPVTLGEFIRDFEILDGFVARFLRNEEKMQLKYSDAKLAEFGDAAGDARGDLAAIAEDLESIGGSDHAMGLRQRREAIVAPFSKQPRQEHQSVAGPDAQLALPPPEAPAPAASQQQPPSSVLPAHELLIAAGLSADDLDLE